MARASEVDKMSYAELAAMEKQIEKLKVEKAECRTDGITPKADRRGKEERLRYPRAFRQGWQKRKGHCSRQIP
jgi:hypothetical protein